MAIRISKTFVLERSIVKIGTFGERIATPVCGLARNDMVDGSHCVNRTLINYRSKLVNFLQRK